MSLNCLYPIWIFLGNASAVPYLTLLFSFSSSYSRPFTMQSLEERLMTFCNYFGVVMFMAIIIFHLVQSMAKVSSSKSE